MPSNILSTDTMFPELTEKKEVREYLEEVSDYLFLLKEQLGYSLHNLGVANFNTAQLAQMTKVIRDPIFAQIRDTDDNVASLQLTAAGLISRMDNFGGESSTIEQTVGGISTSVSSISSAVDDLDDSVGAIAGNYVSKTTATQTSSGFKLEVRSGTNAVMTTLDKDGLTVHRGAIKIKNNAGSNVLYADEYGNLFLTGTISGANIYGSAISTAPYHTGNEPLEAHARLTGTEFAFRYGGEYNGLRASIGIDPQMSLYYRGKKMLEFAASQNQGSVYSYENLVVASSSDIEIYSQTGTVRIYGNVTINGISY